MKMKANNDQNQIEQKQKYQKFIIKQNHQTINYTLFICLQIHSIIFIHYIIICLLNKTHTTTLLMEIKKILLIKLTLMILSLCCSGTFLILKIIFQGFIKQEKPLQYTLCSQYVKEKYSYEQIINLIQNIQLIFILLLQILIIIKCFYIHFKEKPQRIEDVAGSLWLKAEFIINSVIMTFIVCYIVSISNTLKEQQSCEKINIENFLIYLLLIISTLIIKLLLTIINFYLISKNHSQLNYLASSSHSKIEDSSQLSKFLQQNQIFQNLQKIENQNIFNMDSKQIRQQLLNQHKMPSCQDSQCGFQFGNRFSQFQKNYQTKIQRKIKKLKQRQGLLNGTNQISTNPQNDQISRVINEPIILSPQDQLDPAYDREKVQQVSKQTITKLQQKGYIVQERPYIERLILSKKFKAAVNNKTKDCNILKNEPNLQQQQKNGLNEIFQQNEQTIQIVLNLDTREKRAPDQCYTGEDLESLQLDKIFYREYIEKQKRDKQQLKLKILKQQRQKQLEMELQNSQRLKCSYHQYIAQDHIINKKYQQALQYASKKKQNHFVLQQLALHLKTKSNIQLQNKALYEEINKNFKDQIRIENPINGSQIQKRSMRTRKSTQIDFNGLVKFKDRKNPIQIIRGKGSLY